VKGGRLRERSAKKLQERNVSSSDKMIRRGGEKPRSKGERNEDEAGRTKGGTEINLCYEVVQNTCPSVTEETRKCTRHD